MSELNKSMFMHFLGWLFFPRYKSFFLFLASSLYLPLPSNLCFAFNPALLAAFLACFLASGNDELGNFLSTDPKIETC